MKIVILLGENESHITKNLKIVRKILIILKIFMNFLMGAMLIKKSSFYWRKMSRTLPKTLKIVRKCLLKWLRKCVVNVFLLEMRDRGDLTEEWAMIPVTKKHENILPESQLVTKKHRCFFDVFSWQTENGGDVTKNSNFLFRENGRAWSVFIYKVKAMWRFS